MTSRVPVGESLREDPAEIPKDPLEDFTVPPARTPFGEGFLTPSGSFPWIPDLGPILDEIWAEGSFKRLSEEPLLADNRENMWMLTRVRSANALPFDNFLTLLLPPLFVAGITCEFYLLPENRGHLRPG